MCGWQGKPDPIDAAAHGEETPGVIGPFGLTPDVEAVPPAEAGLIQHEAKEVIEDSEPELSSQEVQRLAIKGIGAVMARTFNLRAVMFAGNIILARILTPQTFGLFAIVNFIVLISSFLADMGMGAALVQRKGKLSEEDLRVAFTLGLIVDGAITLVIVVFASKLVGLYSLVSPQYSRAVMILASTVIISTFSNIPAVKLERNLRFKDAANAELISKLIYITTAVALAATGFHILAFVFASLASCIANTIIVNIMAPWRPRLSFDRERMRSILSFGIPYQLTGLVYQVKDNFVPIFVAAVSGPKAVGYIVWAVGLATNGLLLQVIVSRVTFPTYARLQGDLPALKDAVEKSIKWVAATVFPITFLLMALAHQIVRFIYGVKWAPGLPSFYLLCVPILAASYSSVLVSALQGVGRAKVVLKLSVIWAIAGWAIAVPMTLYIGFNGFALAMVLVSSLSLLSVREMNKVVKISFIPELLKFAILSGVPAIGVWVMSYRVVHGVPSLIALAGFGGLAYIGLLSVTGEVTEFRTMIKGALQRA
ncbi:MAG: oligosaccharide flippase family protein [Actinomycetota bacterium]